MRTLTRPPYIAGLLLLAIALAPAAQADTMLGGSTQLISGTQSYTLSFVAPSSGTVSVELAAIPWSERVGTITNLNLVMTNATDLLVASEPMHFEIGGAGEFYAHICGTVEGGLGLGLFSLRVMFTPERRAAAPERLAVGYGCRWRILLHADIPPQARARFADRLILLFATTRFGSASRLVA